MTTPQSEIPSDPIGWGDAQVLSYEESIAKAVAPWIPLSWVTARDWSLAEFESAYQESKAWPKSQRDEFEALWQMVQEGDEFCTYMSPPASWKNLCGRGGWAVIRNGVIVGQVVAIIVANQSGLSP